MKTKAVRIHGKMDLRLEEIELPQVGPDDVQVKIISDSICMSTYKAAVEGEEHKRVPNDVAEHPTIVGHEFCGVITEVGENWKNKYKAGQGFAIQPAHFYKGSQMAPGYSYQYCGGDSQYSNIPIETLLTDNLLPYNSDTYFYGSLAEPMSCIIGTFHAMYHTKPGCYEHQMGIVEGGKMAMLASVGPMGLGAIDYALHCDRRPSLLVITDIDDARLARAESIYTVEHAKEMGVELHYVNTAKPGCDTNYLRELSGGTGWSGGCGGSCGLGRFCCGGCRSSSGCRGILERGGVFSGVANRADIDQARDLIAVFIELLDQGAGCGGFAFELRLVGLIGEEDIADVDCIADILLPLANDARFDCNAFFGHQYAFCHKCFTPILISIICLQADIFQLLRSTGRCGAW